MGLLSPVRSVRVAAAEGVGRVCGLLEGVKFARDALGELAAGLADGALLRLHADVRRRRSEADEAPFEPAAFFALAKSALFLFTAHAQDATPEDCMASSLGKGLWKEGEGA